MYTHTLDTRPIRLRTYPRLGSYFFLRGRAGLDTRANLYGRAILRGRGRTSLCLPLELAQALQEEEEDNEGLWEEGRGSDESRGKMPAERGRGEGMTIIYIYIYIARALSTLTRRWFFFIVRRARRHHVGAAAVEIQTAVERRDRERSILSIWTPSTRSRTGRLAKLGRITGPVKYLSAYEFLNSRQQGPCT